MYRILGLIPARGGSKGVPRKNLRLVGGRSLLEHAIRAARESRSLSSIVTSTDDEEIATAALNLGCEVLDRPAELAGDEVATTDVAVHAISEIEKRSRETFDAVVIVQPTAPLRTGADIDRVVGILMDEEAVDSVVSVCLVDDTHPSRMYRIDQEGRMSSLWPQYEIWRRQDLPPVYCRNGAIYAARRELVMEKGMLLGPGKRAYIMPASHLANIDEERDLLIADRLFPLWEAGRL